MEKNKKTNQIGRVKSHSLASNYSAQISSTSTSTNFYVQTLHLLSPQNNKNSTSKFYFPKNNNDDEEDAKHLQNAKYQLYSPKQLKSLSHLMNNISEKQTKSRSKSNKHFILTDLLKSSSSSKDFNILANPSQIQSSRSCFNEKQNIQFLNVNNQIEFQPSFSQIINLQAENNSSSFSIKQQEYNKSNFNSQNNFQSSRIIHQIDLQRNNLNNILGKECVHKTKNTSIASNNSQFEQRQKEKSQKDFDVSLENDDYQHSINQRNKILKKLGSIIKNQSDKSLNKNFYKFQENLIHQNLNRTNDEGKNVLQKDDQGQNKKQQYESYYQNNNSQAKEANKIVNFFNIFKDSPKYDDIKFKLNVPTCFKNVFKQEKSPNSKLTQMQQIVCQNQRRKLSPGQALTALKKAFYHLKNIKVNIKDLSKTQIFSSKPFQKKFSYELIQAAKLGDIMKVIECLNENRFLVFDFDYIFQTALHWATKRNHYQIVDMLIKNGADVNSKDIMGRTPLFFAIKARFDKICLLLLENKASPWSTSQLNYVKAANENIQIIIYLNKFKQIDIILGMIPKQKHQQVWQKYIQTLKS